MLVNLSRYSNCLLLLLLLLDVVRGGCFYFLPLISLRWRRCRSLWHFIRLDLLPRGRRENARESHTEHETIQA